VQPDNNPPSNQPPRIAVLLASYNGQKHIEEQISSIVFQTMRVGCIFVSDDRSDDGTDKILARMAAVSPIPIVVLPKLDKRIGSATKNFFYLIKQIDFSAFDFVFLADQDDIWLPNKVRNAMVAIAKNKVECYGSNLLAVNFDTHVARYVLKCGQQTNFDYIFQGGSAGCTYCLSTRSVVLVQEELNKCQDVENISSHDWFIYALTRSYGIAWFIDCHSSIIYRQHLSNVYGHRGWLNNTIKKLKSVQSGWYINQIKIQLGHLNPADPNVVETHKIFAGSLIDRVRFLRNSTVLRRRKVESLFCALIIIFNR